MLTIDQFQAVLPKQMRKTVNPVLINKINTTMSDPALLAEYRNNLLSYTSVLSDGRFKMESYLDAVRYCSFKLLGHTNMDSFIKTFPQRYQYFINNKTAPKDIASYVCSYNKNKLVNLIMEQTMIPSYVLNADYYQKALNVQAKLMVDATSEKVRTDAANSLLTHLRPPETKKLEIDVGIKQDKTIDDLRGAVLNLVSAQKEAVRLNMNSVKEIAHSNIVSEGEFEEVQ